jgi:hypothetical protein
VDFWKVFARGGSKGARLKGGRYEGKCKTEFKGESCPAEDPGATFDSKQGRAQARHDA